MATTVNKFWGPDNMDPSVWTHKPRDCGVHGVSFPSGPLYTEWDSLNNSENSGRKVSVSQEDINKFAVGAKVTFGRPRGKQHIGVIVKCNPKKAVVQEEGRGKWTVPYSLMKLAS